MTSPKFNPEQRLGTLEQYTVEVSCSEPLNRVWSTGDGDTPWDAGVLTIVLVSLSGMVEIPLL